MGSIAFNRTEVRIDGGFDRVLGVDAVEGGEPYSSGRCAKSPILKGHSSEDIREQVATCTALDIFDDEEVVELTIETGIIKISVHADGAVYLGPYIVLSEKPHAPLLNGLILKL